MAAFKEKRRFARYEDTMDLVYALSGSDHFNNATTGNCSMGGMFIISRYPLAADADIIVKALNYCAVFEARVLRSEKIADSADTAYGHGIEFFKPIMR